jgi:hypothetical protein
MRIALLRAATDSRTRRHWETRPIGSKVFFLDENIARRREVRSNRPQAQRLATDGVAFDGS